MNRNKLLLCGILAGFALSLSACSQNNTASENNQITVEPIPTKDNASAGNDVAAEGDGDSQDNGTENENNGSADNQNDDPDTGKANGEETEIAVSITFVSDTQSETAEDGTEIYTSLISYPVVEITGNQEAAKRINADIMKSVEIFQNGSQLPAFAKENYELDKEYFYAYSDEMYYTVKRADNDVISFTRESYEYSGGAHGNITTIGINYDPNTGARLSFSDLTDDEEHFRINTLEYNQKTAATEEYVEKLFTTDSITNGELENALYEENKWYFSAEGLVFISDPYLLGPWAAGTIEFTIPYEELAALGMKDIYTHPAPQAEIGDPRESGQ